MAINPHQACKEGEFGMTTKHARGGEMVGNFATPRFKQREFGVTTKHARRVEMVDHFSSPIMQARRVWGNNQACKEG